MDDVGFLERIGIATYAQLPATSGDVAQVADLPPAIAQAFGINVDTEAVREREAKTIPSVRRGEQVIAGTISGFPLIAQRVASGEANRAAAVLPNRTPIRRPLLEQPDSRLTASEWKRRVVVDLIYRPVSWVRKVGKDRDGFPAELRHLDHQRISIDFSRREFRYDGEVIPEQELVRFDSPGNGLLADGAVVLRTALKLEAAVRRYAELDVPLGVLRDESDASPSGRQRMTDDDIDALLAKWVEGAKRRTTRYIGRLKYEAVQLDAARIQLAEARQRSDVAIAQLLNLDSQQINAPGESSMTYVNAQAIASGILNAVAPYMRPIAERLSWPDITPAGQLALFDSTSYLRGTMQDAITAAVAASGGPVLTKDEARARFFDLPPMEGAEQAEQTQEVTDAPES